MRLTTSSTSAESVGPRVYQAWKGRNKFLFDGRLIFGPDVMSLIFSIILIIAPIVVFCLFIAKKLMGYFAHHWGVSIIVAAIAFTIYDIALLLLTSGRDPGIVPRNAHPPEPECFGNAEVGGVNTPQLRFPRTRDVVVNDVIVKVKYCESCMLYRPPRCSHCSICNNCIQRFDHHCPWVGQCIGLRNYRFFFMFIFTTFLLCVYVFAFCWVYVKHVMGAEHCTVWRAFTKTPASVILIIYSFVSMWFVGGLSIFHLYLISTNQTTYENFRYRYDERVNPYHKGCLKNFMEIFFASIPPPNNFRAKISRELQPISTSRLLVSAPMEQDADIEMARRPVVWDAESALEESSHENIMDEKDEESTRVFPLGGLDRVPVHTRRSSWGRISESLEMPPEVVRLAARIGGLNRSNDGVGIASTSNEHGQT